MYPIGRRSSKAPTTVRLSDLSKDQIADLIESTGLRQSDLVLLAIDRLATNTRLAKAVSRVQPSSTAINDLARQRDEIVKARHGGQNQKALLAGLRSAADVMAYLHWLADELGLSVYQLIGLIEPVGRSDKPN